MGRDVAKKVKPAEATRSSRPYRVFDRNIRSLSEFNAIMHREELTLRSEFETFGESLESRGRIVRPSDWTALRKLAKRSKRFRRASDYMWMWPPVHLVTFLETYLQDLLAEAARLDAELMSKSEQTATYAEVSAFRSVRSLAEFLRHRWARNWVESGGPTRLLDRLNGMGAEEFPKGTAESLELMWGVRHVVVHRSGFATRDFVARHPDFPAQPGKLITIPKSAMSLFWSATVMVAKQIDAFAIARWPGLLPPARVPKKKGAVRGLLD